LIPVFGYLDITILLHSRGSSVTIGTRLRAGQSGFNSRQGQLRDFFLFAAASRPALDPNQPLTQWLSVFFSRGQSGPGREADHSPPSSAEVKNAWSYTSTYPIRLYGKVLN